MQEQCIESRNDRQLSHGTMAAPAVMPNMLFAQADVSLRKIGGKTGTESPSGPPCRSRRARSVNSFLQRQAGLATSVAGPASFVSNH